jgi:ABC-type branched-subunit amino acid transport system substrate-binding protein
VTNGGTGGGGSTSATGGHGGGSGVTVTGLNCAKGQNGGATAPGVTATQIRVASTIVSSSSSSVAQGFLGEAGDGMRAAIQQFNNAGGDCGRKITDLNGNNGITELNDDWSPSQGNTDISSWVNSSAPPFALVGEPDSEGLDGASTGGTIDRAAIPVVGSDGMLKSQYHDPWIFPVASSTVSNMHIIADYAVNQLHANSFGIVYDSSYKFGVEGATAFVQELQRRGKSLNTSGGCNTGYCGIDPNASSYTTQITQFNGACAPCDVVVMLLETGPMENWMGPGGEGSNTSWYRTLEGGEPLFDYNLGSKCGGCGNAPLHVWTGYCAFGVSDPSGPSSACRSSAVNTFCQALHAVPGASGDDCQNEFTQGAYLGTLLFIQAVERVDRAGEPLTRANLQATLNSGAFDLGLSQPLQFGGGALPAAHIANDCMASYKDNYSGSFNGWTYDSTGFLCDAAKGSDL